MVTDSLTLPLLIFTVVYIAKKAPLAPCRETDPRKLEFDRVTNRKMCRSRPTLNKFVRSVFRMSGYQIVTHEMLNGVAGELVCVDCNS